MALFLVCLAFNLQPVIKDEPWQPGYVLNSYFFCFHGHKKLNIWCEIPQTSRCHSLDNQTVPSEVQMSPGHTFRDCQHSDEPENSWGNTRNWELPKTMSKRREKTLANVSMSLVAFLHIFLSFRSKKIEVQCFLRRQSQANSAAGLATLIRWGQHERVIDFSSLQHSPSGNSRTPTKSSAAEELIIHCYLCWSMGLSIPVTSSEIVFLNNSPLRSDFFFNDLSIQTERLTWIHLGVFPNITTNHEVERKLFHSFLNVSVDKHAACRAWKICI